MKREDMDKAVVINDKIKSLENERDSIKDNCKDMVNNYVDEDEHKPLVTALKNAVHSYFQPKFSELLKQLDAI